MKMMYSQIIETDTNKRSKTMNKGQKLFIIKTIAGDYVDIKKSAAFAKMAVEKAEKEGHQCIVIEVTVDEIHSK